MLSIVAAAAVAAATPRPANPANMTVRALKKASWDHPTHHHLCLAISLRDLRECDMCIPLRLGSLRCSRSGRSSCRRWTTRTRPTPRGTSSSGSRTGSCTRCGAAASPTGTTHTPDWNQCNTSGILETNDQVYAKCARPVLSALCSRARARSLSFSLKPKGWVYYMGEKGRRGVAKYGTVHIRSFPLRGTALRSGIAMLWLRHATHACMVPPFPPTAGTLAPLRPPGPSALRLIQLWRLCSLPKDTPSSTIPRWSAAMPLATRIRPIRPARPGSATATAAARARPSGS